MSRNFTFVDHTADIAVSLEGSSLEELFTAGAESWLNSVTEETNLQADDIQELDISADSVEELLVSFLNEINFYLISKKWLFVSVQSIKIFNDDEGCELSAELNGTKVNDNFEIKQEIKSVTYHQVEIKMKDDTYSTLVVFDI
jgi:SHS2 domain-containing protein